MYHRATVSKLKDLLCTNKPWRTTIPLVMMVVVAAQELVHRVVCLAAQRLSVVDFNALRLKIAVRLLLELFNTRGAY
jgi:hypothetical protein